MADTGRANFGSRLGVVLATAGSAVGLGNIWRFPYLAGENGGAAFILIYIACVLVLGIPCMISEFIIGRRGASNTARAYTKLANGTAWRWVGYLEVLTGYLITGYYAVVTGWCLNYIYASIVGELKGDPAYVVDYFNAFVASPIRPIFWTVAIFLVTHFIIVHGIRNGIEKASKLMMPTLFVLLLVVVVCSCLLPNADKGLAFLFKPDFSKVSSNVFLSALGQAFYSLSIAMGCLCTYASYFSRQTHMGKAAIQISVIDTLVAVLAGMMIFPAAFSVSLHEVNTAFVTEELHISRKWGALLVTVTCCAVGTLCSLSLGIWDGLSIGGKSLFDALDYVTGQFMLPLAGFLMCLFVGWYVPKKVVEEEFTNWGTLSTGRYLGIYRFFVRFVCPLLILCVFLHQFGLI